MVASIKKFVFVVGPTASGKSQWALEQARRTGGCIVNCDSVQFYKGLDIGSAAPSVIEKNEVPHFLYSYVEAPQEMTAGVFIRDFYQLLETQDLPSPVFVVGGTGFYLQALEKGMYDIEPVPEILRNEIEKELETHGPEALHAELFAADPETIIHVNDHYRLVRAIEILRHTGKTPKELKLKAQTAMNKNAFPSPYIKIGFSLEKEMLLERVQKRSLAMIKDGIVDETKYFLEQGFGNWAPLSSVGYRDVVDFLIHNKSIDELQSNMVTSTMQLIKKQKTWFRRDPSVLWSDLSDETLKTVRHALDLFLTEVDPLLSGKR